MVWKAQEETESIAETESTWAEITEDSQELDTPSGVQRLSGPCKTSGHKNFHILPFLFPFSFSLFLQPLPVSSTTTAAQPACSLHPIFLWLFRRSFRTFPHWDSPSSSLHNRESRTHKGAERATHFLSCDAGSCHCFSLDVLATHFITDHLGKVVIEIDQGWGTGKPWREVTQCHPQSQCSLCSFERLIPLSGEAGSFVGVYIPSKTQLQQTFNRN